MGYIFVNAQITILLRAKTLQEIHIYIYKAKRENIDKKLMVNKQLNVKDY